MAAPHPDPASGQCLPRFRKIQSFKTTYATATITQYESERSGMQVLVADRQGPKISGYFTLATEILDDSGAPHTLEHLIFMGSKNYPFKGLLDKLASRAYSSTNAWTATDNTTYTLETAGWDGFAQILPVYLEHIIQPTITDDACITEVHHVDGEGNDAGVVYSEMQAWESHSTTLMTLAAQRLIYPENVAFRYETGGMLGALRKLKRERIREFHDAMYQPRNLAIVVVGDANHESLLAILDKFEESTRSSIPPCDAPFKRPFLDSPQPPPLKETVVTTVEFPTDDESIGEVVVGFFGPHCRDPVAMAAFDVIMTYLCGSSVAVLENIMVEKEALASSISYSEEHRPNTLVSLEISGVTTAKLGAVEERLFSLLGETASQPLDMTYIQECISRQVRQIKLQAERSETFYANELINDFVYGQRDGSTLARFRTCDEFDEIGKWTDAEWRAFLKKWFLDAHHVTILGKPSSELAVRLKETEQARLAKRREELGPDGLKKLADRLEEAKRKNDEPLPKDILARWPVPSTDSIHLIRSSTARSGMARKLGVKDNATQKLIDGLSDGQEQSLFVQFGDVPSKLVHITVMVNTSSVPVHLKPLVALCHSDELFFNLPVMRNGRRLEFEEVVKELEKVTVSYSVSSAKGVDDKEALALEFIVEPEKYENIISWIRTIIVDRIFDPVRLKASIVKTLADIPDAKRDGSSMASEIEVAVHRLRDSYLMSKRALVLSPYLRRLEALLRKDADAVVSWFNDMYRALFAFSNTRILVAADVPALAQLANPVKDWEHVQSALSGPTGRMNPIADPITLLSPDGKSPGHVGAIIVPIPSLETSFSTSTATFPLTSLYDTRLPACLVALAYLEAIEGPLWNAVRGNGLAYGVRFARDVRTGLIHFAVYRSPDASKAIAASRAAVRRLSIGDEPLDKYLVEGAVSSIVSYFADAQATMQAAVIQNFALGVVQGVEEDFNEKLMPKLHGVTHDDIRAAMKDLLLPVFDPERSNVVVTCAPIMTENMEKSFVADGYKVQVKALSDYHDGYGLEGPKDGEDDDDSDVGDDGDGDDDDDDSDVGDDGDGDGDDDDDDESSVDSGGS